MHRHWRTIVLLALLALTLAIGCTSEAETPAPTEAAEPPPQDAIEWVANGEVYDNEYPNMQEFDGMTLWWRNDADYLYLALEGETQGWISIGLAPENGMEGADYLFGYVTGEGVQVWDAYGTAPTGNNHPPDEELGGSNDIVTYAGVEENGTTLIEWQIPLDSGDEYDNVLEPGQSYPAILAYGTDDDFEAYHEKYFRADLALSTP